ncbi:ATP-binding protein [Desulfovibrio sp. TomC]|uniref:ATP-binding protein n=1 Tax=Desulfovibrio sp. TomC TaxID=1562888 RepID=UPI00057497F4|nr:ATP-binding protein [Desulfovibrio sp. TomC]KHK02430.1 Lead, cadmium, zinc and mercury transporting ATPase [Desulfovibrio sp. TomC]
MKIKTKLIVGSCVSLALLVLLALLARHDMDRVVDKLRFVEVQDDLNADFLEMRLAEKNLFLFGDKAALREIAAKIDESRNLLAKSSDRIVRGAGQANYLALRSHLDAYAAAVEKAGQTDVAGQDAEGAMRETGRAMREFSTTLVSREREQVGEIISLSRRTMTISLAAVVCTAVLAAPLLFLKILRSLAKVERLAGAIAEGKFESIAEPRSHDELDSVIRAVNSMSQRLSSREAEILQSKKLASLGTLTAGVAHEITNPVNNISMIAETYESLQDDLPASDRLEMMRQIQKECGRIHGIVTNLLDFSKPKAASMRPVAVNALVTDTLPLVRNMLHVSNIDLRLDLAEDASWVLADVSQMHQVLINLITNAIQSMPPGGRLRVATRAGAQTARIVIADNGKGIPSDALPHVFDPFFSTKGTEGTGLGLSVSYGIVKNHAGRLWVESMLGAGTTCFIELPSLPPTEVPHAITES